MSLTLTITRGNDPFLNGTLLVNPDGSVQYSCQVPGTTSQPAASSQTNPQWSFQVAGRGVTFNFSGTKQANGSYSGTATRSAQADPPDQWQATSQQEEEAVKTPKKGKKRTHKAAAS